MKRKGKTRRQRKQRAGGTRQLKMAIYADPQRLHRININNLDERRLGSIILGTQGYLRDNYLRSTDTNMYIGSYNLLTNTILIRYGTMNEDMQNINEKDFPPGAAQKILNESITLTVIDNDKYYLSFYQ